MSNHDSMDQMSEVRQVLSDFRREEELEEMINSNNNS
jgi:hypothetical protein